MSEPGTTVRKRVRITGRVDEAVALREALLELERATRAEPGCREFEFYQALGAPHRFVLLEEFVDAAALERHLALAHTRAFFARDLVAGIEPD